MWLTPTNGTSQVSASAFAADTPTSSAPMSPGPDRARHRVDALALDTRLDDGSRDHRVEQVEVGAAGDLGHDAAELGVQVDLGADRAGHDVVAAHHQRCGGLVAAGLDAEHQCRIVTSMRSSARPPGTARGGGRDTPVSAMSWHHITIASSTFS